MVRSSRLCWLKDPFDLLTIQIEGSARVILEDGTPLRVSYDSHNGYRYSSIERVLVERNFIPRKEMSIQRIRDWMAAHPDEAAKVRAANRSYVSFAPPGCRTRESRSARPSQGDPDAKTEHHCHRSQKTKRQRRRGQRRRACSRQEYGE